MGVSLGMLDGKRHPYLNAVLAVLAIVHATHVQPTILERLVILSITARSRNVT